MLIYDDFRSDNEGTLRDVFRFLDVEEDVPIEPVELHQAVSVRPAGGTLVGRLSRPRGPAGRMVRATVRTVLPPRMRLDVRRKILFTKPETPDEGLMRELRSRFKGEVVALSEHLGRDLVKLWGYDDVG